MKDPGRGSRRLLEGPFAPTAAAHGLGSSFLAVELRQAPGPGDTTPR